MKHKNNFFLIYQQHHTAVSCLMRSTESFFEKTLKNRWRIITAHTKKATS